MDNKMKYGEFLVQKGLITKDELNNALDKQRDIKSSVKYNQIGNVIASMGILSEEMICSTLTEFFEHKIVYKTLEDSSPDEKVLRFMTVKQIEQYGCIPIALDTTRRELKLGTISQDIATTEYVKSVILNQQLDPGYTIIEYKVLESSFLRFLTKFGRMLGEDIHVEEIRISVPEKLKQIYRDAIKFGASDVHIDPYSRGLNIKLRIATECVPYTKVGFKLDERDNVWRTVCNSAGVPATEISNGKIDATVRDLLGDGEYSARVNIQQVIAGNAVTLRIIPNDEKILTMDELGFSSRIRQYAGKMTTKTSGLFLITGFMGSGKNTTIYALLKELNNGKKHIVTVEDPVERKLDGINQVPIDSRIVTFGDVAESIVRQDVNVLFIGEIRDEKSLDIAVNQSTAGIFVVSTLHINRLPQLFTRLDGISRGSLRKTLSALEGVVCQKLVKKLCPYCREEIKTDQLPTVERITLENLDMGDGSKYNGKIYKAVGCSHCMNTGYLGAAVVAEYVDLDYTLKMKMYNIENPLDAEVFLYEYLNKTQTSISYDGLLKLHKGITTMSELLRQNVIIP